VQWKEHGENDFLVAEAKKANPKLSFQMKGPLLIIGGLAII